MSLVKPTHHAVRVGVAGLGDRQTLNDLRSHPGESSHHCHVGGVGKELRRPKVANLESTAARTKKMTGLKRKFMTFVWS